jgi:hypothetical protein
VLKSASLPVVGPILKPFVRKHRYRCRDCGWTGWKHRLRRRNAAFVGRGRENSVETKAAWFFIAVVVFLIVVTMLLLWTWYSSRPVEVPVAFHPSRVSPNSLADHLSRPTA